MLPARPTLRALREDLKISVPPVFEPLDELEHPLLAKAREQFADENAAHERIRAIDDQVLLKVKVQRWRGAVRTEEQLRWVVAAGRREDGSQDDFYKALENQAVRARANYNRTHTSRASRQHLCRGTAAGPAGPATLPAGGRSTVSHRAGRDSAGADRRIAA